MGVRVSDPWILDRLEPHLPYGWKPSERTRVDHLFSIVVGDDGEQRRPSRFGSGRKLRRRHTLFSNAAQAVRTRDVDELLERFEALSRAFVAEFAKNRVFVHAGVVAWRGRTIVIPGRSMSGKTSLVAELVRNGATYYSDEYAVLDARGRVHPYVKPLSIRENGGWRQTDYTVEELGGVAGKKPLPVGCVVVTHYDEGVRWRPSRLTPGRSALALFSNTVSARRDPAAAFASFNHAVAGAIGFKGRRGEAEGVAGSILQSCDW